MKTKTKENPKTKELLDFINKGLAKKAFITIIACCKIKYTGKRIEKLGSRDRIIMIKPDSSLIIHHEYDLEPVNSLPPQCKFHTIIKEDNVYIIGFNGNSSESLEVEIHKGHLASFYVD